MSSPQQRAAVRAEDVEPVVEATRLIAGLIAASLASLEPPLTMPQWRVLVLASESNCNVSAVAEDLGVHMSNATRTCDRLVRAGLLERQRTDVDRRQVLLVLSDAGRRLYEVAMGYRRRRLEALMAQMDPEDRAALARTTALLVAAANGPGSHSADG